MKNVVITDTSKLPSALIKNLEMDFHVESSNTVLPYTFFIKPSNTGIILIDYSHNLKKLETILFHEGDSQNSLPWWLLDFVKQTDELSHILFLGSPDELLEHIIYRLQKSINHLIPQKLIVVAFATCWKGVVEYLLKAVKMVSPFNVESEEVISQQALKILLQSYETPVNLEQNVPALKLVG